MTASTLYLFRWGIKNLIENNIAKSALLISLAIYMGSNIYLFTSAGGEMVSTMRYFSCMFPTFFVGGKFLSAFPNLIMPITIICAVLLGAFSALFIIGFNAVVA